MAVCIRPVEGADVASILEIYRPIVRETWISFEVDPPSEAEVLRRIEALTPDYPWLVCELDGELAGYSYASPYRVRAAYRWSVDVSVYVHAERRRRGVGSVLYLALLGVLTRQGFRNAYAGIALPNPASVAFHEKLGFRLIGVYEEVGYKLGRWCDVGWWGRKLDFANRGAPSPPVPFDELQRTDAGALAQAIRNALPRK